MLQRGLVDFVIKLYPQGAMSQVLDKLEVGQTLDFKGPKGRFKYERRSKKAIGGLRSWGSEAGLLPSAPMSCQ
jgi:cytochrome-b5 reductase